MKITHVSLCLAILFTSQATHDDQDHKTWKVYGGGPDSSGGLSAGMPIQARGLGS